MHPIFALFLDWLLSTPRSTREVIGLPQSIAERVTPSLEALSANTPSELVSEILAETEAIFRECLSERGVPEDVYELVLETEPASRVCVVRILDDVRWYLADFDDFMDHGLHARGSPNLQPMKTPYRSRSAP
jgi:hypothetical protein